MGYLVPWRPKHPDLVKDGRECDEFGQPLVRPFDESDFIRIVIIAAAIGAILCLIFKVAMREF